MKKRLAIGIVFLVAACAATVAFSQTIYRYPETFAWDPSPSTNVAGYTLVSGPASRTYDTFKEFGNVTNAVYTLNGPNTTNYISAYAWAWDGTNKLKSDFCNEVVFVTGSWQPGPPVMFRIAVSGVESSTNNGSSWYPLPTDKWTFQTKTNGAYIWYYINFKP